MSDVRFSPRRVFVIAQNTLLEAARQRLFVFLVLFALGLVGSVQFFREFNFGSSELKFIGDFGLGAITLFGSILAVVAATQLFFSEIENRTALTILAKPVFRAEFILGKYFGVLLVLLAFTVLVGGALGLVLWMREGSLIGADPDAFEKGRLVAYGDLLVVVMLQWLKFGLISAFTILIASYSNTNLFTVAVSFFVLVICHLQHLARDAWAHGQTSLARIAAGLLGLVFPNFQLFNLGEELASGGSLSIRLAASVGGYALIYITVVLALAVFSFRRREI